jgi:hypothetical protein
VVARQTRSGKYGALGLGMYGFSAEAKVKALEPNKRILVEWSAYDAPTDIGCLPPAPMARRF